MSTPFVVVPIVEGYGEVEAVPILLRRITTEIDPSRPVDVRRPIRIRRDRIGKAGEIERYIELAARNNPGGSVLVLLDADDDCPVTLSLDLHSRVVAARPSLNLSIIVATKEFEAWFLAAAGSLRDKRGLAADLEVPPNPENVRDAKGWLQERRTDGFSYSPTTDQAALTAVMDLHMARRNAPSFDKLWRDVARLMQASVE